MTPNILENISTWLVDWSLVTIMGNTTPPRDPNDENDEDDEDEGDKDDEDDKDDKGDKDDDEDDENDDTRGRTSRKPTAIKHALARFSATAFPTGEILPAFSRPSKF
jgi:hypothetical protein